MNPRNSDFVKSLIGALAQAEWPNKTQATLFLDGQPYSTGQFWIGTEGCAQATFQPTDESNLDTFPANGGMLKLSEKKEQEQVRNFHRCRTGKSGHWHFEFAKG